jgi:protease-4
MKELTGRVRAPAASRPPGVALIYASGAIRRGRSGRSPLTGGAMGSDTISAALRAAAEDSRARAIVLRVNSPGGSYVASDTIWREVARARAAGKPVVVSMGNVAASGGYYISMAADAIVAEPGTVTGSIGVIVAKPVLGELLGKAGVHPDSVTQGEHASMFGTTRPFTESEWALVNQWLDHVYADFTGKVAAGRRLPATDVDALARGRVWTGADARGNGLVDELGGLDDALAVARLRGGLPDSAPVSIFPRTSPVDRLRVLTAGADQQAASAGAAVRAVTTAIAGTDGLDGLMAESWGPVSRLAAAAGLAPAGPLLLPGSWTFL